MEGHQDSISDCLMEENKVNWKVIRTTSMTDGGERGRLEGHQDNISDCLMDENKVGWKVIRTKSVTVR